MNKFRKIKVFYFFILVMLAGYIPSAYGENVVAFGDSITAGYGSIPYSLYLQDLINDSGGGSTMVNKGLSGELTINGVNRIEGVLNIIKPAYILIMEGANDVIFAISPKTTIFNLGVMLEKSIACNAIPILSTITPDFRPDSLSNAEVYNPGITSLSVEKNVTLVDSYASLISRWPDLNIDGLHPNAEGARILAHGFYDALPYPIGGRLPVSMTSVYSILLRGRR